MSSDTKLTSEDTASIPLTSSPAPADSAVFSDDVLGIDVDLATTRDARADFTPPSSPPTFPWEKRNGDGDQDDSMRRSSPHATPSATMSAFSVLGKRKALSGISENARPSKKVAPSKPESQSNAAKAPPLMQMQISIGQEVQRKCKTCGMEYVPSSAEDRKLHDKYHKQNTEGYDVGKDFVSKTVRQGCLFAGAKKGDSICAVDCFDSYHRKRRGQAVLEIVQRELGAVEIPESKIWDVKECEAAWVLSMEPTYRAYLYVRGTKCIGFLLVKKIKEAFRVIEPAMPADQRGMERQKKASGALATLKAREEATSYQLKQPIELSAQPSPALLGVSRIWTSPTHRHQDIATTLLDTALKDYNARAERNNKDKADLQNGADAIATSQGLQIVNEKRPNMDSIASDRNAVAFSQPTEAGTRLARRWFGRNWGWHVYIE